MAPRLGPLKPTGPMMGPLNFIGPGVTVPPAPPLGGLAADVYQIFIVVLLSSVLQVFINSDTEISSYW